MGRLGEEARARAYLFALVEVDHGGSIKTAGRATGTIRQRSRENPMGYYSVEGLNFRVKIFECFNNNRSEAKDNRRQNIKLISMPRA